MAYKVMLDAGHGGTDPGAVYQGRQEKDDALALAQAVGEILRRRGIDVEYTRTEDIYQTPFEKARIANESGADYFISFHRNASPRNNQYSGAEVLVYDKSGKKLEMAEDILEELGDAGFQKLGVKARPGLVVLRRTKMPAILIEAGFLNTDEDNQIFDERFQEIAQGIADGILDSLGDVGAETAPLYYRVQVGAYRQRQNADRELYRLQEADYPAFLVYEDGYYKVQVGAFQNIGNAIAMEQRLRRDGYMTLIVT